MNMNQIQLFDNEHLAVFFAKIDDIMAKQTLILNNEKLFNFHDDAWSIFAVMKQHKICLGQLVLLWQNKTWLNQEPIEYYPNGYNQPAQYKENHKGIYMFRSGGSPFSGIGITSAWFADHTKAVRFEQDHTLFAAYREVAERYPYQPKLTDLQDFQQLFAALDIE